MPFILLALDLELDEFFKEVTLKLPTYHVSLASALASSRLALPCM